MKYLLSTFARVATLGMSTALAETYKWITYNPQGANDAQSITTQWFVDEFAKRTGGKHNLKGVTHG